MAVKVGRVHPCVCHNADILGWAGIALRRESPDFSSFTPGEPALQGSFRTCELDSFWLVLTWKRCLRSVLAVPWLLLDIVHEPLLEQIWVKHPRCMGVTPQHQPSYSAKLFPLRCATCCRHSCGWSVCLHVCSYQLDKYHSHACCSRLRAYGSLGHHSAEIGWRLYLVRSPKHTESYCFNELKGAEGKVTWDALSACTAIEKSNFSCHGNRTYIHHISA